LNQDGSKTRKEEGEEQKRPKYREIERETVRNKKHAIFLR